MKPGETYKYLGLDVGLAMGRTEPRRALVAHALHLTRDIPNAALYTKTGHGVLGMPQFLTKVPVLERLTKTSDATVTGIAQALLLPLSSSANEHKEATINTNKVALSWSLSCTAARCSIARRVLRMVELLKREKRDSLVTLTSTVIWFTPSTKVMLRPDSTLPLTICSQTQHTKVTKKTMLSLLTHQK
ncbi:hypothetical protein E2C01_033161 [Portunus trituberculatus]|uniref:Uncharacterized protein n=1 Tax=Portunus trituberculatus TaxID=210409 RepID=A0A5B7F1Q4_PORTR|nr:hypothetical protein [Portunus trituberculatus]